MMFADACSITEPNIPFFDITLVKKEGSLGFTIHKKEDGCLYVKDMIKEPAISAPFLTSGDRILLVNGVDASSLSHEGAISFLRSLPETVNLRLQPVIPEDIMQEIDAACEGRGSSVKKRKELRHEARMWIKEKSTSPSNTDSLSRLKLRRDRNKIRVSHNNNNNNHHHPLEGNDPVDATPAATRVFDPCLTSTPAIATRPWNPNDTRLPSPAAEPVSAGVVSLQAPVPPNELRKTQSSDALLYTPKHVVQVHHRCDHEDEEESRIRPSNDCMISNSATGGSSSNNNGIKSKSEPRDDKQEKHLNPNSFTKWRGQNLDHVCLDGVEQDSGFGDCTPKTTLEKPLRLSLLKNQGYDTTLPYVQSSHIILTAAVAATESVTTETTVTPLTPPLSPIGAPALIPDPSSRCEEAQYLEVTFEKGWASRLGIQLENDASGREPHACIVKQIVANTIASADGRVKVGYKLLRVNDFDLREKEAKYVIDLLRKMKGKICMQFQIQ